MVGPKTTPLAAERVRRAQEEGTSSSMSDYTDVTYEVENGLAWITINQPDSYLGSAHVGRRNRETTC